MLLAVPVGAYLKLIFVRYIDNKTNKKNEMEKATIASGKEVNKS
jgi:hypothetical protein